MNDRKIDINLTRKTFFSPKNPKRLFIILFIRTGNEKKQKVSTVWKATLKFHVLVKNIYLFSCYFISIRRLKIGLANRSYSVLVQFYLLYMHAYAKIFFYDEHVIYMNEK